MIQITQVSMKSSANEIVSSTEEAHLNGLNPELLELIACAFSLIPVASRTRKAIKWWIASAWRTCEDAPE